jgi:MFS family permease
MGISGSLYIPAAITLAANAHGPAEHSRAIAILTSAQISGTAGGGWFGGWMAQHGWGRGAFLGASQFFDGSKGGA